MVKYTQSALDTEHCSSATQSVVPEGNMDIPVALRLKLQNQQITEIETIAVRPGDYSLGSTYLNPAAIITATTTVKWEESRPAARHARGAHRLDRQVLPDVPARRLQHDQRLQAPGERRRLFRLQRRGELRCRTAHGNRRMTPRLILADVETGIGVGFTMFMGNTDMHMFKMYGGQVHAVHAILGAASSSGW